MRVSIRVGHIQEKNITITVKIDIKITITVKIDIKITITIKIDIKIDIKITGKGTQTNQGLQRGLSTNSVLTQY